MDTLNYLYNFNDIVYHLNIKKKKKLKEFLIIYSYAWFQRIKQFEDPIGYNKFN
jgi:hypothetical protein